MNIVIGEEKEEQFQFGIQIYEANIMKSIEVAFKTFLVKLQIGH